MINEKEPLKTVGSRVFMEVLPPQVARLIECSVDGDKIREPLVLKEIREHGSEAGTPYCIPFRGNGLKGVISMPRLNDIRYINKFLECVNERLPVGGILVGCVETSGQRRERQMTKFPWPLNTLICYFDYFIFRVWPKLPYLKKVYFALTKGRDRVLSEMETYGRLYSCGYTLVDSIFCDGKLFFLAEKVKQPDYNMDATYGPLIRLQRIGKNGNPIGVYKFRTMYPYSEYLQHFIYERCGLQEGGKMREDPRINAVGQFMRRYWIDEIPMLINLFNGDLKLFGVRPLSRQYLDLYPDEYREYRKKFKPGLIPPFYADLPQSLDEIVASEKNYLNAYERSPILTDLRYLRNAFCNIIFKMVRSN